MKLKLLTLIALLNLNLQARAENVAIITTTGPVVADSQISSVVDQSEEYAIKVFGKKIITENHVSIIDPKMTLVRGSTLNGVFVEFLDSAQILAGGKRAEYIRFSTESDAKIICQLFGVDAVSINSSIEKATNEKEVFLINQHLVSVVKISQQSTLFKSITCKK